MYSFCPFEHPTYFHLVQTNEDHLEVELFVLLRFEQSCLSLWLLHLHQQVRTLESVLMFNVQSPLLPVVRFTRPQIVKSSFGSGGLIHGRHEPRVCVVTQMCGKRQQTKQIVSFQV